MNIANNNKSALLSTGASALNITRNSAIFNNGSSLSQTSLKGDNAFLTQGVAVSISDAGHRASRLNTANGAMQGRDVVRIIQESNYSGWSSERRSLQDVINDKGKCKISFVQQLAKKDLRYRDGYRPVSDSLKMAYSAILRVNMHNNPFINSTNSSITMGFSIEFYRNHNRFLDDSGDFTTNLTILNDRFKETRAALREKFTGSELNKHINALTRAFERELEIEARLEVGRQEYHLFRLLHQNKINGRHLTSHEVSSILHRLQDKFQAMEESLIHYGMLAKDFIIENGAINDESAMEEMFEHFNENQSESGLSFENINAIKNAISGGKLEEIFEVIASSSRDRALHLFKVRYGITDKDEALEKFRIALENNLLDTDIANVVATADMFQSFLVSL